MMRKTPSHFFKLFLLFTWLLEVSVAAICPLPGKTISQIDPSIQVDQQQIAIDNAGNTIAIWSESNSSTGLQSIQYATHFKGGSWSQPQAITSSIFPCSNPQIAVGKVSGNAVAIWRQLDTFSNITYLMSSQRPFNTGVWSTPTIISVVSDNYPQIAMNDSDYAVAIWGQNSGGNIILKSAELSFGGVWTNIINVIPLSTSNYSSQKIAVDPAGTAYAIWANDSNTTVQTATLPMNGLAWSSPVNPSASTYQTSPDIAAGSTGFAAATWLSTSDFNTFSVQAAVYQAGVWGPAATLLTAGSVRPLPIVAIDAVNNVMALWSYPEVGIIYSAYRPIGSGVWNPSIPASPIGSFSYTPDLAFDGTLPAGVAHAVWVTNTPSGAVIEYTTANGPAAWAIPCGGITPDDEITKDPHIAVDPTGFAIMDWINSTLATVQATYTPLTPAVTGVNPPSGPSTGGNNVVISGLSFENVVAVSFGGVPALSYTVLSETVILAVAPPGLLGSTVNITVETLVGTSPIVPADEYSYVNSICWQR